MAIRPLLQPPRLWVSDSTPEQPRRATWLELFYDLVFVVAISQLAHRLSGDVSFGGFFGFVALFIPLWWAWIGTTFYANRFDSDDLGRRILMGLQMLAIAALAVNIHHGLSSTSVGFALAYGASRLMLVLEYLWAGFNIPAVRKLTTPTAIGFGFGAILWLLSAFVPLPVRFSLWVIGLVSDFLTPLTVAAQLNKFPPHPEHLPERFGLFTIIVLGEAIIAVVNGVSEMNWGWASSGSAIAGFVTAFSLWWIYFDNVSGSVFGQQQPKGGGQNAGGLKRSLLWLYIHLPLVIGLAATGVGVEHGIEQAGYGAALTSPERWLICGCVGLCYGCLAVLHRLGIILSCKTRTRHRLAGLGIMLALAIFGAGLSPLVLMSAIALVGIVQVALDIYQGKPELMPHSISS